MRNAVQTLTFRSNIPHLPLMKSYPNKWTYPRASSRSSPSLEEARFGVTDYLISWGWRKLAYFGMGTQSTKNLTLSSPGPLPLLWSLVVMVPFMNLTDDLHCHQTRVTQEIQCVKEGWSLSTHDSRIFQEREHSQKKRQRQFPCPPLRKQTSGRAKDSLSLRERRLSHYDFGYPPPTSLADSPLCFIF